MQLFKDQFNQILQDLSLGKIILMPTDTIWGLICDATNPEPIQRILDIKGIPQGTGLVTLVANLEMLKAHVPNLHPRIETLLLYHQRPLTVIYENAIGLSPLVQGPEGTYAIRLTLDPLLEQIMEAYERPLVATAACVHGTPYPTHFGEIMSDILTKVDHITKYRQDDRRPGVASVIARMGIDEELEFLRL